MTRMQDVTISTIDVELKYEMNYVLRCKCLFDFSAFFIF